MKISIVSQLFLGAIMVSTLLGCRSVEHYLYNSVEVPLFEGKLKIAVKARPKDYEGENLTRYEAPYSLEFSFVTMLDQSLNRLQITDVLLTGKESGADVALLGREKLYTDDSKFYKDLDTKSIYVLVGYEGEMRDWPYEPYNLSFLVRVYRDSSNYDEKVIEVSLEPDFRKSRRSDWFDAFMSV